MSLHPIKTTQKIVDAYKRYLKTIYPFRNQELRHAFWQKLDEPKRLIKGPLLEASPPFKTERAITDLVQEGVLHPNFGNLCRPDTLPYNRPLYVHQEKAVRNVVERGRNLIVATGTGSGKTESFLIPILNHLLREEESGTLGHPGVRALLLYPMNALANDQLKRLRTLLENYPAITFGRYIGETRYTHAQALEQFGEEWHIEPLANELISREEMQGQPPHILLTNYAMLEYLLLRPQDIALFDGPTGQHWKFIVVDEAHVYDGASGIEVAMLLRRLKDRIVQSELGHLTCIATSATLGAGREDFPKAAEFAEQLFGESFSADDVFEAERKDVSELGAPWGEGTAELYEALSHLFDGQQIRHDQDEPNISTPAAIAITCQPYGLPDAVVTTVQNAADTHQALYAVLRGDKRLHELQRYLQHKPDFLTNIAQTLFPTLEAESAQESAIQLVNLAVRARADENSLPLIPARYHVFARALEGAFVCFHRDGHSDRLPLLFLSRHEKCPECTECVFEIATCARCGISYIVAEEKIETSHGQRASYLHIPKGGYGDEERPLRYFILSDDLPEQNEDEQVEESLDWQAYTLCLRCGQLVHRDESLTCSCPNPTSSQVWKAPFDGTEQDRIYCSLCAARSRGGGVYRFLTGQDAPVSVLATALYSELPPSLNTEIREKPGQGRKLLIFADSRQDAAFFAPYLERTYNNILRRRLIYNALQQDEAARSGELTLEDLAERLREQSEKAGIFAVRESRDQKMRKMYTWLMQELSPYDRYQSLEGLGLLHLRLRWPQGWQAPTPLLAPPWNLSTIEAEILIRLLLDSLRRNMVFRFPEQVDPENEVFAPRNRKYFVTSQPHTGEKLPRHILRWSPAQASNGRLDLLEKVLAKVAPDLSASKRRHIARETLQDLWDKHLSPPDSLWRKHGYLVDSPLPRQLGIGYQLDYAFWEWAPILAQKISRAQQSGTQLWLCNQCRNLAYNFLRGICTTYGCQGQLESITPDDLSHLENHYRDLYQNQKALSINVEEHTAQWTAEEARKVQNQFVRGDVNVLSCSTTFELGVDVGELQAVLMRNVPPATANYVQRAGRAGRRADAAAFALTFAQRRSHDLAHYRAPEKIVAGHIPTPVVAVRNPKIVQRHMHSVLIAAFLRWCVEEHDRFRERREMRVGPFFDPENDQMLGSELFRQYLDQRPDDIRQALTRLVPSHLQAELGIADWTWLDRLREAFDLAEQKVQERLKYYEKQIQQHIQQAADPKNKKRTAAFWRASALEKIRNTITDRDLLNFFGQHNVLPKYGFPVDVVEFITDYVEDNHVAERVELQRDLRVAISEFAPGSKLVAAKKVWTGGGIYRLPDKGWEPEAFAICPQCHRFNLQQGDQPILQCQCGHDLPQNSPFRSGILIRPEFGFLADRRLAESGEARPPRQYTSRVYFNDYARPQNGDISEQDHQETVVSHPKLTKADISVSTRYSRYGQLVLVNHGPNGFGFHICSLCGYAQPIPASSRQTNESGAGGRGRNRRGRRTKQNLQHKDPQNGRDCRGENLIQRRLGHSFITDVLEIQLTGRLPKQFNSQSAPDEKDIWRSLLYAFIEGASQELGIRRDDINGTIYYYTRGLPPALLLYDDVPGGAGHMRRVNEALYDVFHAAYKHVACCECGEETACHQCLWHFRNQPFHHVLSRGLVAEFLRQTLDDPQATPQSISR